MTQDLVTAGGVFRYVGDAPEPTGAAAVVAATLWCVALHSDPHILSIGTREQCQRYLETESHGIVRRLIPLSDVNPTHALLQKARG